MKCLDLHRDSTAKEGRMDLTEYMARDRAIQMAQEDWRAGRIAEGDVINKARQYESYLLARPVAVIGEAERSPARSAP